MADYRVSGLVLALAMGACGGADINPDVGDTPTVPSAPSQGASAPSVVDTAEIAYNRDKNAYFGDLHIHTANSFDAFIFGTRTVPDDAYRFAKGEQIRHDGGYDIQIEGPPLDFLAVTDHGEYMGVVPAMANPLTALNKTDTAQSIFGKDAADPRAAFLAVGVTIVSGEEIDEIYDRDFIDSVWGRTVAAAERHNVPGKFTTFAGYEFTAMRRLEIEGTLAAANLHRNVIFRGQAPERLFTTLDSTNPEDLWNWMGTERSAGREVLAIPHNSNASNGEMFATESYLGEKLSAEWSDLRARNEPLVEITQLKGTSETHPSLSPNDEYSGFEQYEYFIGSTEPATVGKGDFVRPTYGRGLEMEASEGFNPYKFGLIGSSDTHVSAATLVEENHWGKFPPDGAGPEGRLSVPPNGAQDWTQELEGELDLRQFSAIQYASSGLAGVWAEANTREAIFDAMAAKETFGTSGPRMRVRLFAGFDYEAEMLSAADMVSQAYAGGVPMGGELDGTGASPKFLAWAMQDALSAPLQRMQMIKVWTAGGAAQERIYDIACSGGDKPDATTRRCPDNGANVSLDTCQTNAGTGTAELKVLWSDPDYEASHDAVYYVRVLENPTCRWSTWDAVRNATPPNPDVPATVQERAWTSPVFVKPK